MKILLVMIIALCMIGYASACLCTDTDQAQPKSGNGTYGPWGDNGLLGGTTFGIFNNGVVDYNNSAKAPLGCTLVINDSNPLHGWQYTCNDLCIGTTLREFYCGVASNNAWSNTVQWHDYEDSTQCAQVPEFPAIGAVIAATGAILGIVLFRKK